MATYEVTLEVTITTRVRVSGVEYPDEAKEEARQQDPWDLVDGTWDDVRVEPVAADRVEEE